LFDNLPAEHVELDAVRRLISAQGEDSARHVTHMRYRVRRHR
jgi:hypothetical protein